MMAVDTVSPFMRYFLQDCEGPDGPSATSFGAYSPPDAEASSLSARLRRLPLLGCALHVNELLAYQVNHNSR